MTEDFTPTHVVPPGGLSAWENPGDGRPAASLDALLPVLLADRRGDWGRIVCANGWSAWVDARLLVVVPQPPPATGRPLTRTADQRPQLAKAGEAVSRYRSAADDLAGGRIDGETFRSRTRGLRAGVVIDGESVWLYEAEHERWVYGDGVRLGTYAVSRPARDDVPPGPGEARDGDGRDGDGQEGDGQDADGQDADAPDRGTPNADGRDRDTRRAGGQDGGAPDGGTAHGGRQEGGSPRDGSPADGTPGTAGAPEPVRQPPPAGAPPPTRVVEEPGPAHGSGDAPPPTRVVEPGGPVPPPPTRPGGERR